ncbi:Hypothetical protein SRAE_1000121100 [Strongyloides ratti]|uniref:Uncharacterized protein n=1 Tax=Strongyloides ratti TaxID=34506 RepID=A0A090L600_STRRB|nr:Hypothetical protein SRAE_1000121100 [Strongyloides ratti]CEF62944.1 Hypothetical protein SRAE_1000121100 [Strongyloides ratti]
MLYILFIKCKKILIIILGILLIYTVKKVNSDLYKLHKCEISLKKTLASILQNSNDKNSVLLTPFHETIAKFKNDSEAYQRIMWGCFSIFRFEKCLSILEDSHLKNIKLASIKHWKEICNYARERREDFHDFLNCERRHIFKARNLCTIPSRNHNQTTLEIFCEDLYEYNKCYRSIDKRCAESALELSYILDEAVIESYTNVVKLATYVIKIPGTCNWIMKPNIKEISKNKYKESRESKKQEKSVYTLLSKKNITDLNFLSKKDDIKDNTLSLSNDNILIDKHDNRHHHTAKKNNLLITTTTEAIDTFNDEEEYENDSVFQGNNTIENSNEVYIDFYESNKTLSQVNFSTTKISETLSSEKKSYDDEYHYNSDWKVNSSDMITQIENTSTKSSLSSIFGLIKNKSNCIYLSYHYILLTIILFI